MNTYRLIAWKVIQADTAGFYETPGDRQVLDIFEVDAPHARSAFPILYRHARGLHPNRIDGIEFEALAA